MRVCGAAFASFSCRSSSLNFARRDRLSSGCVPSSRAGDCWLSWKGTLVVVCWAGCNGLKTWERSLLLMYGEPTKDPNQAPRKKAKKAKKDAESAEKTREKLNRCNSFS
jgi:hypothetical protein